MEKSEFRVVIRHLYLKGLTPKEIKANLDEVQGTFAPVFATVYNWVQSVQQEQVLDFSKTIRDFKTFFFFK